MNAQSVQNDGKAKSDAQGTSAVGAEGTQIAKVVPMEDVSGKPLLVRSVNLERYPFTRECNGFYQRPGILSRNTAAVNCYVRFDQLVILAKALGRQIELDEMKLLVGREAASDICSVTRESFVPVWWIDISGRFLDRVWSLKKVDVTGVIKLGSYFVQDERFGNDVFLASGTPFMWDQDGQCFNIGSAEKRNPIFEYYRNHDERWGLSFTDSQMVLEAREKRRQEQDLRKGRLMSIGAALKGKLPKK